MKQGHVDIAGTPLIPINTVSKGVVQEHVQTNCILDCPNYVKVKSIKYIGKQDVYNMEVAAHHNFSVNGGLIVHNCIDQARYACEDDMKKPGVSFRP